MEGRWAERAESCASSNLWQQLTQPFRHVLDSSPSGTAAAASKAEPGHVTLGKESQHVSNSLQTNHWIRAGINHALASTPTQRRWLARKSPRLSSAPPARNNVPSHSSNGDPLTTEAPFVVRTSDSLGESKGNLGVSNVCEWQPRT